MEENEQLSSADVSNAPQLSQEIFQRAQETRPERRFPVNSTGIVPVPRGSKGPRSLYLRRYGDSFGFTLRHFIVYPPEFVTEDDGRHAACGALLAPMDTIFVKQVRERSSAKQAGLQRGDRLVAVNGVPVAGRTYQEVVQLIANSPEYLHLLVVPKEEDVLQRFFPDTAYNPASNQAPIYPEGPVDRASAQQILSQRIAERSAAYGPQEFRVDAASWRYLQQPYLYDLDQYQQQYSHQPEHVRSVPRPEFARTVYPVHQRSAESVLDARGRGHQGQQQEIYAEIHHPNEVHLRHKSRAQPQVPLYRKMGRRASEGSNLLSNSDYIASTSLTSSDGDSEHYSDSMKAMYSKPHYLPSGSDNLNMGVPDAGCRLQSSDVERRESTSSLSSSVADSSKDSITSFGSNSTLTGHEIDDSVRISRVRQSVRQKEEFLRTPVLREFHGRPRKLERAVWPPTEPTAQQENAIRKESPVRNNNRPMHQNFRRIKNDIENEREIVGVPYNEEVSGGMANIASPLGNAHSPKAEHVQEGGVREAETAPYFDEDIHGISRAETADERRMNPSNYQIVQKRAKEFEAYPEDSRTDFSRSELARLSKKVLMPKVTERAHEYEVKTASNEGLRKDPSTTSTGSGGSNSVLKRIQRDSRSLDSSGSSSSIYEPLSSLAKQRLSGNVIISSGSKFIHCPPPGTETKSPDIPSNTESRQFRARSNSAESWATAVGDKVNFNDKPVVVKRRNKTANYGHDERAKRPDSYLKATKGDQNSFGSDLSDYEDGLPQVLRNRYRKWHPSPFFGDIEQLRKLFEDAASSKGGSASGNSSSSVSSERDKASVSPVPFKKEQYGVVREGIVNCKILEIDGKRAADRSWKQVVMVLKGPRLFLYKDRNHQSPLGTSDVSLDQSLASGVDMRSSAVRVAGDYTKRKNVLRMSTVKPCRSEFLIQAESTEDFADWVKTLQEQVAVSTEAELDQSISRQQAVPQTQPASTTIQVQGSHLSPQPATKNGKSSVSSRNRSPTGQSPVSKTRKPSSQHDNAVATSPKSKTWRGRVAKQFRKFNQGATSPSSPTAPEGSTFGIPIEDCIPSNNNVCVPRFVEVCTDIIDEKGLQTLGIYRVPGNNASITALSEEINRNYEEVPLEDPRWNDLHVVSSLLKSYLRKMPDSLVTSGLYPHFIKADKIEDPNARMKELRKLVRNLPKHNYHTLKHVILHLKRVADNSQHNRMEARNLAIVFGPTIVRPESETMESMVTNMTNQCQIVESLITNADWFFPENESENVAPLMVPLAIPDNYDESDSNQQALLNNISKYEALKDPKEKNGALLSSLFNAAQRKVMRKPSRTRNQDASKEEPTTPTSPKSFAHFSSISECKENTERSVEGAKVNNTIPTTVSDIEKRDKSKPPTEKNPWYNYKTDKDEYHRRIENFRQETEAMLQRPRKTEISVTNIDPRTGHLSSSASNVNTTSRLTLKPQDFQLTKTHSATNVFTRQSPPGNRNSLNSMDSKSFSVQYHNNSSHASDVSRYSYSATTNSKQTSDKLGAYIKDPSSKLGAFTDCVDGKSSRYGMRRGSSVENVNSSTLDLNSNGGLKKVKYESKNENQRRGSLDSIHKLQTNDDESLLSTMTKLIDQKLSEKSKPPNILLGDDIPFVDESPEKHPTSTFQQNKENVPRPCDLYKNPSLHKSQYNPNPPKIYKSLDKNNDFALKETKNDKEKEVDTRASENVPDNERLISLTVIANKFNPGPKLKRSESLNKPERTGSPMTTKVKRSESLNKTGDKLKRSDSLTKTEKTESNINKRRELLSSGRRLKESTKNKRKNGMPDRSIKRRHTVGGTKDPDKVTYIMDNKHQEENSSQAENNKEKGIRTSSPDLSSTRRERFLFEINLFGPENMVVALRQHLIGSRPQSFPETNVFKVPLESHV